LFQSTPTGFPAGDAPARNIRPALARFNPRRPVSRPATAGRPGLCPTGEVSIHADRFPGRRHPTTPFAVAPDEFQSTPTGFPAGDVCATPAFSAVFMFQSTQTGFPAGDVARSARSHPRGVSIHADRFPGRRLLQHQRHAGVAEVSIHADRFPGRRLSSSFRLAGFRSFQSTPTGFPAGDG